MGTSSAYNIGDYLKELTKFIEDPNIHLQRLEIHIDNYRMLSEKLGELLKNNHSLKQIKIIEDNFPDAVRPATVFINGLNDNDTVENIEFQSKTQLFSSQLNRMLNAFKDVLDRNRTLTSMRVQFLFTRDGVTDYHGVPIDLHIHKGKLVGSEDANGHVQYEVLEDFPVEFRPAIHEILVKLNRNTQIAIKRERGEKVSEEKESHEEKKSDEIKSYHSSKKSVNGLED